MSLSSMEKVVLTAMKSRVPICLVGAPGTAKTATIRSLTEQIGYELITLIASRMDPQDISGMPSRGTVIVDGEKKVFTEFAPAWWQIHTMQKKKVVLFFDEFSNTHPSVRASLLSFIQDRQFPNGDFLPEEAVIVMSMNPSDSAADGYELDKPTSNRIVFLPWKPGVEEWFEGMVDNWGDTTLSNEERVWRSTIVKFLRENPGLVHRENDNLNDGTVFGVNMSDSSELACFQYAWASRRSWDNLAKILPNAGGDVFVEDMIMQGAVGFSATHSFRKWLKKNGVLDVKKILAEPDKANWEKFSLDDLNTILRHAMDSLNKDTVDNICEIFILADKYDFKSSVVPYFTEFSEKVPAYCNDGSEEGAKLLDKIMYDIFPLYSEIFKKGSKYSNEK